MANAADSKRSPRHPVAEWYAVNIRRGGGLVVGNLVVRILSAVGAVAISATTFGSGVAVADALTGQTYSDAVAALSKIDGKAVIATVSGDQLELDKCIVTSWHLSKYLNSSGKNDRSKDYLLNLNCNNQIASPGHPGNSLATPEGIQAKYDQEQAAKINADPSWCQANDDNLAVCRKFCNRTGLCQV